MSKKIDLSQFVTEKGRRIAEGYSRRLREGRLTSEEKKRRNERMRKAQERYDHADRTGVMVITEEMN